MKTKLDRCSWEKAKGIGTFTVRQVLAWMGEGWAEWYGMLSSGRVELKLGFSQSSQRMGGCVFCRGF